jgi:hypothetical protein
MFAALVLLAFITHTKSSQVHFYLDEYPAPSLPVSNATLSFWAYSVGANPLATHGSEGPLTSDADICIIGSGITGTSAAHVLSKSEFKDIGRKLNVVMLEARDFCQYLSSSLPVCPNGAFEGSGATGASLFNI